MSQPSIHVNPLTKPPNPNTKQTPPNPPTPYFYPVKICMTIIFLLSGLWASAQYPGGYAQFFHISKANNIPGTYWNDLNQAKDGSIIAKPNPGNYVRIYTNNTRPVFLGSSLNSVNLYSVIGYDFEGEIFYEAPGKFLRLVGDSLQSDTTKPNQKWYYSMWLGKGSLVSGLPGQKFQVKYFDGKKFHRIKTPPQVEGILADSTVICPDLTTEKAAIGYKDTLGRIWVYRFEESNKSQVYIGTYMGASAYNIALVMGSDSIIVHGSDQGSMVVKNGIGKAAKGYYDYVFISSLRSSQILIHENEYFIRDIPVSGYKLIGIYTESRPQAILRDRFYNSHYIGNGTEIMRIFPHIVQYPKLFNKTHSNSINTLAQAADGTIYAGSYSTGLAGITPKDMRSISTSMKFLNGATCIGNNLYFFSESPSTLYRYSPANGFRALLKDYNTGFMLTPTRDGQSMLAGLAGHSTFGILDKISLARGKISMQKIGPEQGVGTVNVLTFAEDLHGRIFFGRNSEGWGMYDPATQKAETYTMQKDQTAFGAMSSLCDNEGFVWMGGSKGLWVIDARQKNKITPSTAIRINHPLLGDDYTIGSMKQWGRYLVLGAARNLLLLDLEAFHSQKKIRIRYLNPQESHFTSDCEQNTMLVDHRDSSLWVATSDNLYQIDLRTWLKQPAYKINPALNISVGERNYHISPGKSLTLSPTQTTLHIEVTYQTKDNMPRYLQTAFTETGDSPEWSNPATVNTFSILNKRSGHYTFHLRVLQSDGTITTHSFPITIRHFLWQQWWFWLLISGVVMGVSFYLFYLHKQKQLAEAEAMRIKAEAEALRSEQQRQLTSMQVKSLSTQFRPHFILNALNTVGAQLYDKPEVDAVLGQLGDSIGIIFRNAQSGAIAHPLSQEWRLVMSVINIKQLELNHSVNVHVEVPEALLLNDSIQVPMGILQIPVENALVHGLRNKENGPKDLWILAEKTNDGNLCVTIRDNGIGRKAAAAMGNYRSNGVGTRNIQAILDLLNPYNEKPITIQYRDEPFEEDGKPSGTEVFICIPENYSYER